MIAHDNSLAIDLSEVKSIYITYQKKGGDLVFELNNLILPIENPETGAEELRSFANEHVRYYFDDRDTLRAYFEDWVKMWEDYKG